MPATNTASFAATPQAKDDVFASVDTGIKEDSNSTFLFAVMNNDLGGNAKKLYSLDDGSSAGGASPVDLLTADVAGVNETSALGAAIHITEDGRVAYTLTAAMKTALASLKPGQFATDSFTYAIQMGNGALSWATATVQIAGTNTAPVITTAPGAASGVAAQGATTITGQLSVADADGSASPTWTVQGNAAGAYGVLSVDATGRWTYHLDPASPGFQALAQDETRTETFVVRATDDLGAPIDQVVTLSIVGSNDAPRVTNAASALAGSADAGGGSTVTGQLSASDPDHGATQAWTVQGGAHGTYGALTLDQNGQWTYSLDGGSAAVAALAAGETRTDTFVVRVADDKGAFVDQSITVSVHGTNDAPVATSSAAARAGTVTDGDAGTGAVSGQLSASDVDHGATQAWSVQGNPTGAYGSLSVDASGKWTYVVDKAAAAALGQGETAQEAFTVRVLDDHGAWADQRITITIAGSNDAPVITNAAAALAGSADAGSGSVVSGQLSASDVDHGATQAWSVPGSPVGAYGALAVDASGKWTYTLDNTAPALQALAAGETRDETFTVRVTDDKGASVDQLVTVSVHGTNDAPVATSSAAARAGTVTDGDAGTGTVSGQLSASDVDHGATQAWSVQGNPTGAYGSLSVDASGKWTYVVDKAAAAALGQGETAQEAFTVRVLDDHGAWADQRITITIAGSNDAPVITNAAAALAGSADAGSGSVVSGQLSASDVDHGATQAWSVPGSPVGAYGALAVDASGKWTYTLDNTAPALQALAAGETRDETFTVRVTDDKGASVDQLVTVSVHGTNDAPVVTNTAADAAGATADGGAGSVSGHLAASDVDHGATQTWSVQGNPAGAYGALAVDANGAWTYTLDQGAARALALGETATESFSVQVMDEHGASAVQVITVTVAGANDAPVVTNAATARQASLTDGAAVTASGQLSAADPDHGALQAWSVQGDADGRYGALGVDAGGKWTYQLDAQAASALAQGETYDERFTVRVTDDKGAWVDQVVTVTINGSNDAPVITNSAAALAGNADAGASSISGQLSATDADHGATQAWSVQGNPNGAYGTLAVDASGKWTYVLDKSAAAFQALAEGEARTELFTVRVTDDKGAPVDQTVSVTVTGANDAPVVTNGAASLAGQAAAGGNLVASGQLSASDADHGATQTWSLVGEPGGEYGTMHVDAGGQWTFTLDATAAATLALAAGETHTLSRTVRVTDEHGASVDQVVTITLSGANDAPVAASAPAALAGALVEDGAHAVGGQLAVTDADHGATVTWSVGGNAAGAYGHIAVDAAGKWEYQLDTDAPAVQALAAGESHEEVFTIRATDEHGAAVDQRVTIDVGGSNDAPLVTNAAQAAAAAITDGAAASVSRQLVAIDPDHGATQAWSVLGNATTAYGTMSVGANGVWTYAVDANSAALHALAQGEQVQEAFTLRVTDEHGAQADQQVLVTVVGSNDAPRIATGADAAHGAVQEDGALAASGHLQALDADHGAVLTWAVQNAAGAYGNIVLDQNGAWTYSLSNTLAKVQALNAGAVVTEHFTVQATDQFGAAATQVLTIDVAGSNDAPQAHDDSVAATEDTALRIPATTLLANDTDLDTGHVLSIVAAGGAAHGTLSLVNGDVNFVPEANYNGADSFSYTVRDENGATSSAVVTLDIAAVNDAPVAVDDSATLAEDTPWTVAASTLLANDTDADAGDTKTISAIGNGAHGTVQLAGGAVTYTPALNYNGSDSFTYTMRDSAGLTSTAEVHLTVTPVNDAPVTQPFTLSTANTSLDVLVSGGLLYKSDGNDGFLAAVRPSGLPSNLVHFKVADMNGDGFLDVVGNAGTNVQDDATSLRVSVFLNNGSGVFTAATTVALPTAVGQIEDIEVADLNGDHINDVVVSSGSGTHQVLMGGTNGSLTLRSIAIPAGTQANGVGVADIDGDGDIDLTFASGGTFVNYMNNGAGTFTIGTTIGTPTTNAFYADAFYADLDGSGKLDLLGIGGLDITYTYKDSASVSNIVVTTANGTQTLPVAQSSDAAVGDVNNDGYADLVISVARNYYSATPPAGQSDMIQLWLNDGHGHFSQAPTSLTAKVGGVPVSFTSVHLGDVNGDGLLDLAATGYSSGVVTTTAPASYAGPYVWLNTGSGFSATPTLSLSDVLTTGKGYVNMQFGDLDGKASGPSEDSVQLFTPAQLLAGAVDVEGDAIAIVSVDPLSANGARLTVKDGVVYYDPTASESLQALAGKDTVLDGFTYYVKDSSGATSSGVANVVVRGVDSGDTIGNLLNNTLTGTAGKDTLVGMEGNDTLSGMDGNDILIGGDGADTLNGSNGADLLFGGAGVDRMTGGTGADVFLYTLLSERGTGGDTITDFSKSDGDVLQLSTLLGGLAGYDGTNAISGGFVKFVASGSNTQVMIDPDGAAGAMTAVTLVTLTGVSLTAADLANLAL